MAWHFPRPLNGIINTVSAPTLWETWWLGDLVGGLIVTPFLLTWKNPPSLSLAKQRPPEISVLSVITLSLIFMIFSSLPLTEKSSSLLVLLLLPLLAWTATRFRRHGITLIMIILSTSSIISTVSGLGPFVMATENESLLLLQASVGAASAYPDDPMLLEMGIESYFGAPLTSPAGTFYRHYLRNGRKAHGFRKLGKTCYCVVRRPDSV